MLAHSGLAATNSKIDATLPAANSAISSAEMRANYLAAKNESETHGWYLINETTSLSNLISTIGATRATIIVSQAYTLTASATIPANIMLKFENAGSITLGAYNLVFAGDNIENAGNKQIFIENSSGEVTGLAFAEFEWFGAVGLIGDTGDDSNAIQSSVNAVANRKGKVTGDGGKYYITGISITSDIDFGGDTSSGMELYKSSDAIGISIDGGASSSPYLHDFTLNSVGTATDTKSGIKCIQCDRVLIERLVIKNQGSHGIEIAGPTNLGTIRDNIIMYNTGDGIYASNADANAMVLMNNDIRANLNGINLNMAKSNRIIGGQSSYNKRNGILVNDRENYIETYTEANDDGDGDLDGCDTGTYSDLNFTASSDGNYAVLTHRDCLPIDAGADNSWVATNEGGDYVFTHHNMNLADKLSWLDKDYTGLWEFYQTGNNDFAVINNRTYIASTFTFKTDPTSTLNLIVEGTVAATGFTGPLTGTVTGTASGNPSKTGSNNAMIMMLGNCDDAADTGNEVCATANLTCVSTYDFAGAALGTCTTDQGTVGAGNCGGATVFIAGCK